MRGIELLGLGLHIGLTLDLGLCGGLTENFRPPRRPIFWPTIGLFWPTWRRLCRLWAYSLCSLSLSRVDTPE